MSIITVLWHDEESEGYTDLLPEEWFSERGALKERIHDVRGPRGGLYKAKCNVKIHSSCADLDYGAYPEFNTAHEMYIGTMRIRFKSTGRHDVVQVLWKDLGDSRYVLCSTTIGRAGPGGSASIEDVDLFDSSAQENRKTLVTHLRRERSRKLVTAKKAAVLKSTGALACEACNFRFDDAYGDLGGNYCEVHHRKQLAGRNGANHASMADLAILCSNCHRMIHRTTPMLSVEAFRKKYLTRNSSGRAKARR